MSVDQKEYASLQKEHHLMMEKSQKSVTNLKNTVAQLLTAIQRLEAEPLYYGTVLKVQSVCDVNRFQHRDRVLVVDVESDLHGNVGEICSYNPPVDENGYANVLFDSNIERRLGVGGKAKQQLRLLDKSDGTYAIVNIDGKPWELRYAPELHIEVGDFVKVLSSSKQIVGKSDDKFFNGIVSHVCNITDEWIEVEVNGEKKTVLNPAQIELVKDDQVIIDSANFVILKKITSENHNKYCLLRETEVDWDSIGGLGEAKQQCKNAIELPYQYPDYFKHYNIKKNKGILLYGPPGCGKTMLAKAIATSLAKIHNTDITNGTSYIYVKSPEILSKWVGNTEREIRTFFELGRKHYREHKFPAVLVFDEFDAIAPVRGSRKDITDTIVPMFLGEMDGVDPSQVEENPIVVIMTNRQDMLDPAVIRPGRISTYIKVNRPDMDSAMDIMRIHCQDTPFYAEKDSVITQVALNIFSNTRVIYRINHEYNFYFRDLLNGAMLENICEMAKMKAVHRDIRNGNISGVMKSDFQESIEEVVNKQRHLNHAYDIADFADSHNLDHNKLIIEPIN